METGGKRASLAKHDLANGAAPCGPLGPPYVRRIERMEGGKPPEACLRRRESKKPTRSQDPRRLGALVSSWGPARLGMENQFRERARLSFRSLTERGGHRPGPNLQINLRDSRTSLMPGHDSSESVESLMPSRIQSWPGRRESTRIAPLVILMRIC